MGNASKNVPETSGGGRGAAFDAVSQSVLVIDILLRALFRFDVATGEVTVVSDDSHGSGLIFYEPVGVAVDGIGARAFVIDAYHYALFEVDLSTGDRTVLKAKCPNGSCTPVGSLWGSNEPLGVAWHPSANRVYVSTYSSTTPILSVDPDTLAEERLPNGGGPSYCNAWGGDQLALDAAGERLLVLDSCNGVVAIALASGA